MGGKLSSRTARTQLLRCAEMVLCLRALQRDTVCSPATAKKSTASVASRVRQPRRPSRFGTLSAVLALFLVVADSISSAAQENRSGTVATPRFREGSREFAGPGVKPPPKSNAKKRAVLAAGPGVKPPPARWSGFYAGAGFGYAVGPMNGPVGGVIFGDNFQTGANVFGVETDFDGTFFTSNANCAVVACSVKNHWLTTMQARAGHAFQQYLPFLSAGVAVADFDWLGGGGTVSARRVGLSLGAGLDVAIGGGWAARGEYRYVDFGAIGCGTPCNGPTQFRANSNMLRFGLTYRFNSGSDTLVDTK